MNETDMTIQYDFDGDRHMEALHAYELQQERRTFEENDFFNNEEAYK